MRSILCFALYSFLSISISFSTKFHTHVKECTNQVHHQDRAVIETTAIARELLKAVPGSEYVPIADRLAVMILFSHGFTVGGNKRINKSRLEHFECAIRKLKANLMVKTRVDVYIWVMNSNNETSVIPDWLNKKDFPHVHIMSIHPDSWKVPCHLKPPKTWTMFGEFEIDYYIMGSWRLTFGMDFLKSMGYKYFLQFDDDSLLGTKLDFDLVKDLKRRNIYIGSDFLREEGYEICRGLPELTSYWLAISGYKPEGPLFKHCNPESIQGLTTTGWDRMNIQGNFIILSIDFWFRDIVQDFVTTVIRSGRQVEGRWNEMAVQTMIWQLFVPPENFLLVNDCGVWYYHWGLKRRDPEWSLHCADNLTNATISQLTCLLH